MVAFRTMASPSRDSSFSASDTPNKHGPETSEQSSEDKEGNEKKWGHNVVIGLHILAHANLIDSSDFPENRVIEFF